MFHWCPYKVSLFVWMIATTSKDFLEQSFIEWNFKDDFFEQLKGQQSRTDWQIMFRTRQSSALLLKAQSHQKSKYIILEVCRMKFYVFIAFILGKEANTSESETDDIEIIYNCLRVRIQ